MLRNSFLLHISSLYVSAFFLEVAKSEVCVWYTSSLYVLLLLKRRDESVYEWWYFSLILYNIIKIVHFVVILRRCDESVCEWYLAYNFPKPVAVVFFYIITSVSCFNYICSVKYSQSVPILCSSQLNLNPLVKKTFNHSTHLFVCICKL